MQTTIKATWITAIVVVFLAMIWFVLATSVFFSKRIPFEYIMYFVLVFPAALIFNFVSIWLLASSRIPSSFFAKICLLLLIIVLAIAFSTFLVCNVDIKERMTESVSRDYIQMTPDKLYEYQLQLVDWREKNGYARLWIKDVSTSDEVSIVVAINLSEILGPTAPSNPNTTPPVSTWIWSVMSPTDRESIYILTTTRHLKENIEVFEIDIASNTSRRIE